MLLIEDDEEDYLITKDMLTTEAPDRFELVWAANLAQGLQKLDAPLDGVLLDLSLPDSQGWDTFTRVQQHARQLPIILLTGMADEELGVRAVHAGAQDYLVKGRMDGYLLVRAITYAIERKRTEDKLEHVARRLRATNAELAADLQMARDVQEGLLPHSYPPFPASATPEDSALTFSHRYEPCRALGGDFFYLLPLSDSMAAVFICDVMGHGMRAALVTAIIRGMIEELRPHAGHAAPFMTELNRGLTSVLRRPDQFIFVSAAYLVVDLEKGVLTCANAGHPWPMLIRPGQGACKIEGTRAPAGPVLGLNEDQAYEYVTVQLQERDSLLMFTDGLYEVHDPEGREYGEDRLKQAIDAHTAQPLDNILGAVLESANTFSDTPEPEDDICLVGMTVNRIGASLPRP